MIVMIKQTGLAPWEFKYPCIGSLTSTFLILDAWLERHLEFCVEGPNVEFFWFGISTLVLRREMQPVSKIHSVGYHHYLAQM